MDTLEEAKRELAAIKAQKDEVIADYGKRYAELDTRVRILESKKSSLESALQILEAQEEAAVNSRAKAQKDAGDIASTAANKAREVIAEAEGKAGEILKAANADRDEAKTCLAIAESSETNARDLEQKATEARAEAERIKSEAVTLHEEALQIKEEAERIEAEAKKHLADAQDRLKVAVDKETELASREESVKAKEVLNAEAVRVLDERQLALDKKETEINDRLATKTVELDSAIKLANDQYQINVKQNQANNDRSNLLDLEQEYLNNQRQAVDDQIKKLEALKRGAQS